MITYPPHFAKLSPRLQSLWQHVQLIGVQPLLPRSLADLLGGGAQHYRKYLTLLVEHGYLIELPGRPDHFRCCTPDEFPRVRPIHAQELK